MNDLRFSLWHAKKWWLSLVNFLHTLNQHTWKTSLQYGDETLRPSRLFLPRRMAMDGGSTESGGTSGLCISWMTRLPAPDMILEFTSCKCHHVCQLPSCECMASRLKCTNECSLRECKNVGVGNVVTWKRMIHWWNSRNRAKVMKMTVMRMMTSKLCHWTVMLTSTLQIHSFWYWPLIFWPPHHHHWPPWVF